MIRWSDFLRRAVVQSSTIGLQDGLSYQLVDLLIASMRSALSDSHEVTVRIEPFSVLNTMLQNDDTFVLMSEKILRSHSSVSAVPIFAVPSTLVYSELLFQGQKPNDIAAFRGKPLLMFDDSDATGDYRKYVSFICRKHHLQPELREMNSRDKLSRELLVGNGYTIGSAISNEPASSRYIRTFPLGIFLKMSLLYRNADKTAVRHLTECLTSDEIQAALRSYLQ